MRTFSPIYQLYHTSLMFFLFYTFFCYIVQFYFFLPHSLYFFLPYLCVSMCDFYHTYLILQYSTLVILALQLSETRKKKLTFLTPSA
ncbi:hypothetical protein BGW37DRAFT_225872 [Umbelopsis sp. PMI_123]|nr:hypothetical protein BGW37DRAFT_225872 [Umbelopsis sp. PMI_123]